MIIIELVLCTNLSFFLNFSRQSTQNMADLFSKEDTRSLLSDKHILMLGDSNTRASYKDLVLLLNRNEILDLQGLRKRGEESFEGDKRIRYAGLSRGRQYVEGRESIKHDVHVEYHFITRCYTEEIELIFQKIKDGTEKVPDVVIMNSCIWDISRWGPNGVETYKENMKRLMILLDKCLPKTTLFIWTTTLPVSTALRGGLLIKLVQFHFKTHKPGITHLQIDFLQSMLRFEVMEANLFCRSLIVSHGYDILDTHYHLRMQIHRRLKDGLHYGPLPVRFITNLLLTHIALSWNVPLPGNSKGIALERLIRTADVIKSEKKTDAIPALNLPDIFVDNGDERAKRNKQHSNDIGKRDPCNRNTNSEGANFQSNNMNSNRQRKFLVVPIWKEDISLTGNGMWSQNTHQQPQHIAQYSFWNDDECINYPYGSKYGNFKRSGGGSMRRNVNKYRKKRCGPY